MEGSICAQCRRLLSKEILERCFIPHYETKRRVKGEWKIQEKVLFPGYVFVVTNDIEELHEELKKISGTTRILGTGDEIVPISEREVKFLLSFGGEEQLVQMSEGIIVGSNVIIHSGPLQGKEGYIKKIDRHKRKAWLEIPFFGGMQRIEVGLEVVSKK